MRAHKQEFQIEHINRTKMAAGAVQMLQKSLQEAQKNLSSTDEAIKRLIGRDPNTRP